MLPFFGSTRSAYFAIVCAAMFGQAALAVGDLADWQAGYGSP